MFIQFAAARFERVLAVFLASARRWRQSIGIVSIQVGCAGILALGVMAAANAQALVPGSFIGWGSRFAGETQLPVVSPPITDINAISSLSRNTVALRSIGTVIAWGENAALNLPPAGLNDASAVAASENFMMALRRNGTVVYWGSFPEAGPFLPGYLTDVAAIAANFRHAMALKRDGTVVDWNVNDGSPVTGSDITNGLTFIAIAAGGSHSLALTTGGTVVGWGDNSAGQVTIPAGLDRVIGIAAGEVTSFALRDDGSVFAWGADPLGSGLKNTSGLQNIKAIAAGRFHALALSHEGLLTAWGDNSVGQSQAQSGITNVKAIAAGSMNSFALNPAPLLAPIASYTFSGFHPPVNDSPVINIGKAGRTYPVKWQLKDQEGNFVSALSAVKSIGLASVLCGTFNAEPGDAIEFETADETRLRYDTETNQFIYNWKTPREARCYKLFITLDTNQVLTAKFNLSK